MAPISSTWIVAGAAGVVAAGVGVGAAALTAPWRSDVKERYQDQRYAEIEAAVANSARKRDGGVIYPFPTVPYRDEREAYSQVLGAMAPGGAGLAAAGFGAHAIVKATSLSSKLMGAGGVVAGAALLGAVIGGIRGAGQGTRASDLRHGIDVDAQVDEVMRNFDRDGDGEISIRTSPSEIPEFERRNEYWDGSARYLSIKQDALEADTDGSGAVDRAELRAHLAAIDTDNSGVITHMEARKRHEIETYGVNDPLLSYIG